MVLTPFQQRIVARRLRIHPDNLDQATLRRAVNAVDRKTTDAYDAMANAGQMLDNVDRLSAIAIVYNDID